MKFSTSIPFSTEQHSIGGSYEAILRFLDTMEIGTDCLLISDIQYNDELGFTTTYNDSYYQKRENPSEGGFILQTGLYSFEQLPFTPESSKELLPLFNRFIASEATNSSSHSYIRIYKEKRFEIAVQFFIQKESN